VAAAGEGSRAVDVQARPQLAHAEVAPLQGPVQHGHGGGCASQHQRIGDARTPLLAAAPDADPAKLGVRAQDALVAAVGGVGEVGIVPFLVEFLVLPVPRGLGFRGLVGEHVRVHPERDVFGTPRQEPADIAGQYPLALRVAPLRAQLRVQHQQCIARAHQGKPRSQVRRAVGSGQDMSHLAGVQGGEVVGPKHRIQPGRAQRARIGETLVGREARVQRGRDREDGQEHGGKGAFDGGEPILAS